MVNIDFILMDCVLGALYDGMLLDYQNMLHLNID